MAGQIRAVDICVRVGGTVSNTFNGGGTEQRGGDTKIFGGKSGEEGKLSQGVDAIKRRAGTPLQTMTLVT